MKTFFKWALVLPLIASVSLVSCNKDDDEKTTPKTMSPVDGKTLLYESTSVDAEVDVKVYADEAAFVGYNKVYVMIYETGTNNMVKNAQVSYMPEMDMNSGMMHGAPAESPNETNPDNGLFEGAVVFVMPSEGLGTWRLAVNVKNNDNGKEGMVEGEVTVVAPTPARMFSFEDASGSMKRRFFVSLKEPFNPEVGDNAFNVVVHERESMMSWPAVTGLALEYLPWMPTMGHSSPFENPQHTSDGHYEGSVKFTMTGLWHVYVNVTDESGTEILDADEMNEVYGFVFEF